MDTAQHFPSHLSPTDDDYDGYPHHLTMREAQALADLYCVQGETMAGASEEAGISLTSFKAFRRAHTLRKGKAVIVDESSTIGEAVEHFTEEAKRREVDRKARRQHRREKDRAARKWWSVEEALEDAAAGFREREYEPPRPTVRISHTPTEPASVLMNAQDWHIGKRPKGSPEGWTSSYVQSLKDAFTRSIEKTVRGYKLDKLYLVTGGDLIHVDSKNGTTSGTPQDTTCSPSDALEEAIALVVWCVDYVRALNVDVEVLTVNGNHDRVLSQAAGCAVAQRFHDAEDVQCRRGERIYTTYEDHLILATHGDMKKRQWKQLPGLMMREARTELASTTWQTVVSGHLHFQAHDLADETGTLFAQGSSPSPTDDWHHQQGYISRKGLQTITIEPHTCAAVTRHEPVATPS